MRRKEIRSILITGYGANHRRWTREGLPEEGMGVAFFRNGVQYIRNHLL